MTSYDTKKIQKLTILIEQICKTNGKYIDKIAPSPEQAIKSILNQYSEFKPSIQSCLKDRKNFVNEIIKFSQNSESIKNHTSLLWFKKFLKYILECTKHGLHMAQAFMNKIIGIPLKEGWPKWPEIEKGSNNWLKGYKPVVTFGAAALLATQVSLAIVSGIILLGIGLWMYSTGKIVRKLSSKPSILEKIKEKGIKWFGREEDDLPDDLLPPDLDIPNVTFSFSINSSESLMQHAKEHTKLKLLKAIFNSMCVYALKCLIALHFNTGNELAWIISASSGFLFSPSSNLIMYLLVWLAIGLTSMYNILLLPPGGMLV